MAKCRHHYLLIEEFNGLGCVVSCSECDLTFQLGEASVVQDYYPFTYTSPEGKKEDKTILIHHSRLKP